MNFINENFDKIMCGIAIFAVASALFTIYEMIFDSDDEPPGFK